MMKCEKNNTEVAGLEEKRFFNVTAGKHGGIPVVSIEGESDLCASPEINKEMIMLIDSGASCIIANFSRTEFIDASTLGVLSGNLRDLRQRQGNLIVVCPSAKIRRVFEITKLDSIFPMFETIEDAVESIRTPEAIPA